MSIDKILSEDLLVSKTKKINRKRKFKPKKLPTKPFNAPANKRHKINKKQQKNPSWKSIGICRELCIAVSKQNWKIPTKIQISSIPHALEGKDIIALAETGSGKTAAFAIPILQSLLNHPLFYHSLILVPTRELALQIHSQIEDLGKDIGIKLISIIGGINKVLQQLKLQKKPHIIIGTPGRTLDHLMNCRGFNLHNLKFLVLDEADRILQTEFSIAVQQIIKIIQKQKIEYQLKQQNNTHRINEIDGHNYQTLLFSATMTKRVERLEKASLKEPIVKISVNEKYKTVKNLKQFYIFIPAKHKLCYITYLLNNLFNDRSIIVFTNTKKSCHHLSLVLHNLHLTIIPLHGEMTQYERMGAIEKFRDGQRSILIATDVAARGLDIPLVTVIINYDLPIHSKDYIHRVGRTARAGRSGEAINMVTQYDVEIFQRIEQLIDIRMARYPLVSSEQVMLLVERVMKADRVSQMQMKEHKDEIKNKIKQLSYYKRNSKGMGGGLGEFVMDDFDHEQNKGKKKFFNRKKKEKSFKSVKSFRKSWRV